MNAQTHLTDYRDQVLIGATPLLPMPIYGSLGALEPGRRRYIGAGNGIYVQSRSNAMSATVRLARTALPFGTLEPEIRLVGGLIPRAIYEEIQCQALLASPKEWAGLVYWREASSRYELVIPRVIEHSNAHIRYEAPTADRSHLVLDVHSHGELPAFFSSTDDLSDEQHGTYFAMVLGHCGADSRMTAVTRLVIDGQFFDIPWQPFAD